MKNRFLVILVAIASILSICIPSASAADEPGAGQVKFVFDLTDYSGFIEGNYSYEYSGSTTAIDIEPGKRNEFTLENGGSLKSEVTLGTGMPERWDMTVSGISEDELEQFLADYYAVNESEDTSEYVLYYWAPYNGKRYPGDEFLTISGNVISFYQTSAFSNSDLFGKSAGITITFTPVYSASEYDVRAVSSDDTQGVATVGTMGNAAYAFTATPESGFSFDCWKNGDTVVSSENPYTATLSADTTYTAYFRPWKEATAAVSAAGGGTATAQRKKDDAWTLRAVPDTGYKFVGWEGAGIPDGQENSATLEVELTEDATYTACFAPYQITGISIRGVGPDGAQEPSNTYPLIAGTDVIVYGQLTFEAGTQFGEAAVYIGDEAAAKAEGAVPIAQSTLEPINSNCLIRVENWPEGVTEITVAAWTNGCETYYDTLDVQTAAGAPGLELQWLSSPKGYRTSNADSDGQGRTYFLDMAAFLDKQSGAPSIFAAGLGGVWKLEYGQETDMVRMAGMEYLGNGADNLGSASYALAVGGPDVGDLTAVVKYFTYTETGESMESINQTLYELRYFDAKENQWMPIANSQMPETLQPTLVAPNDPALVMGADDVWTQKAHWNGTEWTANSLNFSTFVKTGISSAYGVADGGVYRYDGESWTKVNIEGSFLNAGTDGSLLLRSEDGYRVYNAEMELTASYPQIDSQVLGGWWTTQAQTFSTRTASMPTKAVGFGGDGKVYAVVTGGQLTTDDMRYYILQASEDGWKLMDTSAAFALTQAEPNPQTINTIANLAEGVTLFYGSNGAMYLQTAEFTITFDSNGGSAVSAKTGQAWSAVDVPRPTRKGYTFVGWFYDNGSFAQPWSETVIPAANITLYAKWQANTSSVDSSADEYREDREKALDQLDDALSRLSSSDYSAENWQKVLLEYENGKYAISAAKPDPSSNSETDINAAIANTIYAALNAAINRMNAVSIQTVGNITVAVSVDANTIGLGYLIKPTLVTYPKYTRAATILTDLLRKNGYSWTNTGTTASSFYLVGIKPVDQTNAKPAAFLEEIKDFTFDDADKSDTLLSEFDYNSWSGWMYSVGSHDAADASFPGVGCSEYRMTDREVMRWQFTVYGYGADLNADNSAWGVPSVIDVGDKGELTWEVASLRAEKTDAELEQDAAYSAAMEALQDPAVTQSQIDAACAALKGQGGSSGGSTGSRPSADLTAKPTATVDADGNVKVVMDTGELTAIVDRAVEEKADKIVIEPELDGDASKVTIELPRFAVGDIVKSTSAALSVKTGVGTVIIPQKSLEDLNRQSGSKASVSMEALKLGGGKPSGQTNFEVAVDGKAMEKLSGGLTVAVHTGEVTAGNVLAVITDEGAKIVKKSVVDGETVAGLVDGSCTVRVVDNSKSFTDTAGHWGGDAVAFAASHELFNGVSETSFAPDMPMDRAMLATVLFRLEDATATTGNAFPDVPADTWYTDAVAWANAQGIVEGTGSGFAPDKAITREQLATMLYRYARMLGMDTAASGDLSKFTDGAETSSWAIDAMKWAAGRGLISGKDNGALDPAGTATRAEVATVLQRLVTQMVK